MTHKYKLTTSVGSVDVEMGSQYVLSIPVAYIPLGVQQFEVRVEPEEAEGWTETVRLPRNFPWLGYSEQYEHQIKPKN